MSPQLAFRVCRWSFPWVLRPRSTEDALADACDGGGVRQTESAEPEAVSHASRSTRPRDHMIRALCHLKPFGIRDIDDTVEVHHRSGLHFLTCVLSI